MIRLISDMHCKVQKYVTYCQHIKYPSIQLGDLGFDKEYQDIEKYAELINVDMTNHFFFKGNHDGYNTEPKNCLGDYGSKVIGGFEFFFVRGAYSIDPKKRVWGVDYFPEHEELSTAKAQSAIDAYELVKPNVMLSHDCPDEISRFILGGKIKHRTTTNNALQAMFEIHQPKYWFFGHYHDHYMIEKNGTTFICIPKETFMDVEI